MLQHHNPQGARVRWGDTVVEYDFEVGANKALSFVVNTLAILFVVAIPVVLFVILH